MEYDITQPLGKIPFPPQSACPSIPLNWDSSLRKATQQMDISIPRCFAGSHVWENFRETITTFPSKLCPLFQHFLRIIEVVGCLGVGLLFLLVLMGRKNFLDIIFSQLAVLVVEMNSWKCTCHCECVVILSFMFRPLVLCCPTYYTSARSHQYNNGHSVKENYIYKLF